MWLVQKAKSPEMNIQQGDMLAEEPNKGCLINTKIGLNNEESNSNFYQPSCWLKQ